MESKIFKFICANTGSVDVDDLMSNHFPGESTNKIISNQQKFVFYSSNGKQKVVAWTSLKLCRVKACQGPCGELHLCKYFLLSGICPLPVYERKDCSFSHDLSSDHNQRVLKHHELEGLTRDELCTLLMQNDDSLLPSICRDYNIDGGKFGQCQSEDIFCSRLHICERFMNEDCNCSRNHDFKASHILITLNGEGVPFTLIHSLKSIYANNAALRLSGNQISATNPGATGDGSQTLEQSSGSKEDGRNMGDSLRKQQTAAIDQKGFDLGSLKLYTEEGHKGNQPQDSNSPSSDVSAAATNTVASSNADQNTPKKIDLQYKAISIKKKNSNSNNHQLPHSFCLSDYGAAAASVGRSGDEQNRCQKSATDKTVICMYFVQGYCKHGDQCTNAHDKMPYRWQVQEGDRWTSLPDNETIERDYCDPSNTFSSGNPPVYFDTMRCGERKVRRLSTPNSVSEPDSLYTTEWLWYWQDDFGQWNLYGTNDGQLRPADVDSKYLDKAFLNNPDVVEFTVGKHSYSLSFQDMLQTNKGYGTKRLVRTCPRFVSAADVQAKTVRMPVNTMSVPDNWDKTQIPQTGFSTIPLSQTSEEFKNIQALFCGTMKDFKIISIKRNQNKALWEVFQWQNNLMKDNNGGRYVTEKQLFHGTDSNHVDAICHNNFDWRICGTHGTSFGKGSYFARDASYSHKYTGDTQVKSMFIARVLVGSYIEGSSHYVRPPSKDGGNTNFYDSCVNNVTNPSIFVVFEKHQIYPEYLLHDVSYTIPSKQDSLPTFKTTSFSTQFFLTDIW
ncbi:protein mono-ADP-ribosyltransferase PARP12-like [Nematolebias whitei]|uniref:protein mono-ADP-ribosyltransferase PARP12-like n=1 Tax=Nematolebias whitei TaxID=451745 RepID=UPI00189C4F34|nr:protein mono-ADP-ribosyltransferase PARP12-like [Nematolebias whitei]